MALRAEDVKTARADDERLCLLALLFVNGEVTGVAFDRALDPLLRVDLAELFDLTDFERLFLFTVLVFFALEHRARFELLFEELLRLIRGDRGDRDRVRRAGEPAELGEDALLALGILRLAHL